MSPVRHDNGAGGFKRKKKLWELGSVGTLVRVYSAQDTQYVASHNRSTPVALSSDSQSRVQEALKHAATRSRRLTCKQTSR